MEGMTRELLREEFQKSIYPADKLSFPVAKSRKEDMAEVEIVDNKKNTESMLKEEEILKARLTELKKQSFSLQASINAWQLILKNKLEEFNKADSKLNEIYNEIWSERESFCSEADKFNDEYGILSEWWEKQMKFVSELENLEKETLENQKCQGEIDELEEKVIELKREVEVGERKVEVEMHEDSIRSVINFGERTMGKVEVSSVSRKEEPEAEIIPEESDAQNFLPADDQIEMSGAETRTTKSELFSMVDLEKMRKANRIKHRSCKSHFLKRVNKLNN